jgi:DNA primase catalytic subunit
MRAVDASYLELLQKIEYSSGSSDASIINYVDGKVGELNNRITITAQELHNEMVASDSSLDARVDTLELKLENEIADRTEDLEREIENLRSSQRNYTDNLRLDVSLGLRETSAGAMIYTDASVARLRHEMQTADASLEERLKAYTDSSVASLDRRLSQDIAAQRVAIDNHIDASVAALKSEIAAGDQTVFDTLKTLVEDGDASVYGELNLKIDATKEELEDKIVDAEIAAKTYAEQ